MNCPGGRRSQKAPEETPEAVKVLERKRERGAEGAGRRGDKNGLKTLSSVKCTRKAHTNAQNHKKALTVRAVTGGGKAARATSGNTIT